MGKATILVIEDEVDIQELVKFNLVKEGYTVNCCLSGEDGLAEIKKERPDLILLDVMLPGMDGFEICRKLQSSVDTQTIPIVMLTAKGEETDIVAGLELGAADYITKPFSPKVLVARIRGVLRRTKTPQPNQEGPVQLHDIAVDPNRHEVKAGGILVDLTKTEFQLLYTLMRNAGRVFTRTQIVEQVHGDDYPVTDRSVDVQVVGLRKKLDGFGQYIETVRGVGYRFKE